MSIPLEIIQQPPTIEDVVKKLCAAQIKQAIGQFVVEVVGGNENIGKEVLEGTVTDLFAKRAVKVAKPSSEEVQQAIYRRLFGQAMPTKPTKRRRAKKRVKPSNNGEGTAQ